MIKKNYLCNIMSLLGIIGIIGCEDYYGTQPSIKEQVNTLEGFWFACEFGSSDMNCMILDDDGLQFTNDGKVYYTQEYTQMSEEECGSSPCFDYSICFLQNK